NNPQSRGSRDGFGLNDSLPCRHHFEIAGVQAVCIIAEVTFEQETHRLKSAMRMRPSRGREVVLFEQVVHQQNERIALRKVDLNYRSGRMAAAEEAMLRRRRIHGDKFSIKGCHGYQSKFLYE